MRNAAIISGGLHVVVITIAFIGLPSLFRPTPPVEEVVVEMVSLDKDLPKPKKKVPPKPQEKPKPPPKPQVKAPPPPPPPEPLELASKPPEPLPVPKPKPAPPKPQVKAKPKPEPKPEPKPAPPKVEAKVAPKAPPKPKRRPKPPPDALQSLLKDLRKQREKTPATPEPKAKVATVAPEKPAPPAMSQVEANRLQAQLADMVRRQVSPCWSLPAGAKNAEEMRIIIRVYLNPDGSLRGPPRIENTGRMATDSFFRAAAESAMRALLNPRCKLSLPVAYYDTWKEIALNFDPKQMLGP